MRHKQAIILSMTRQERQAPRLLNASRKRRIARGSGRPLPEINRVLKEHMEIARAMKRMGRMGLMQKLSTLTGAASRPRTCWRRWARSWVASSRRPVTWPCRDGARAGAVRADDKAHGNARGAQEWH